MPSGSLCFDNCSAAPLLTRPMLPPPAGPLTAGAFVGRVEEMAALREAFAEAVSGHGRLVLLAGDPGIGKTRTAEEFATHARQEGAEVLWGRCHEGESL